MNVEVLGCEQAVDSHAARVLGQEDVEVGFHLLLHPLRREVRIDEIAEIEELRISPVAAVSSEHQINSLVIVRAEECLGYVEVLDVIYLIPLLARQALCLDDRRIDHRDDLEDLLVVLVEAERALVRLEERHVVGLREFPAELVYVDCLVVLAELAVVELLARHECDYLVLFIELDAGAVHPGLVLVDECERLARVVYEVVDRCVLYDQV